MGRYKSRRKKTPEELQEELANAIMNQRVGFRIADHIMQGLMIGLVTAAILTSPFGLHIILKGSVNYIFRKNDFDREIARLKKRGFVAVTKTEREYRIRLFPRARKRKIKAVFNLIRLPTAEVWDGYWRFIVFDIPEKERKNRDDLREKLKGLGAFNVQRSVLVYPFECKKEVDIITEYYDVKKYTTYAVVQNCDIDRELKSHFKTLIS